MAAIMPVPMPPPPPSPPVMMVSGISASLFDSKEDEAERRRTPLLTSSFEASGGGIGAPVREPRGLGRKIAHGINRLRENALTRLSADFQVTDSIGVTQFSPES